MDSTNSPTAKPVKPGSKQADPYNVAVGSVLREVRELRGYPSCYAVEAASNRAFAACRLYQWEAGTRYGLTLASLGRLCAFYDIPTAVVLDRADTRYRASQNPAVAAWQARSKKGAA